MWSADITTELQDIIDRLSADLGAASVLEDQHQRMIVYSAQHGEVDRVRRDSILRRETSAEVIKWFAQFGIADAREPIWIPGSDELRMSGRLCVPVWHNEQLLGFLFVLDDDGELYTNRLESLAAERRHIALLLYEQHLAQRLRDQVVAHLLSDLPDLRDEAATALSDNGFWPRGAPVCAVVVAVTERTSAQGSEEWHAVVHNALLAALEDIARNTIGAAGLRACFADHAVLLLPSWSEDDERPQDIGERAVAAVERRLGQDCDGNVVAGIGDLQPSIGAAHVSYRQGRLAARVTSAVSTGTTWSRWRDLGVFRTLAQLPSWTSGDTELDPRVQRLLREADPDVLHSVETYLDLGCDVQKASAELHLHRGTLYYRIEKVEKVSGLHLRDGNDRLSLHLGFKIARLAGTYPG